MKNKYLLIIMIIISLVMTGIGISGCSAPKKADQTITESSPAEPEEADQAITETAPVEPEEANQAITETAPAEPEEANLAITETAPAEPEEANQAITETAPAEPENIVNPAQASTETGPAELENEDQIYAETALTEFTVPDDYQAWARDIGYPTQMLLPMGVEGINQDYFHTLPDAAGYTSGKIVIGDSRCCQLGIYEQRIGADDFADFAVWGGHFLPGAEPDGMTDQEFSEVEQCFQEQIRTVGSCSIYFFATVNDYDYVDNDNVDSIAAAISTAEALAEMSCEYEGTVYQPEVIVIGFDGGYGDILYRTPAEEYNRYIDDYNEKLRAAVNSSELLQENSLQFTTVPEITESSTGFIEDGLHYSDDTLKEIADYIAEH